MNTIKVSWARIAPTYSLVLYKYAQYIRIDSFVQYQGLLENSQWPTVRPQTNNDCTVVY